MTLFSGNQFQLKYQAIFHAGYFNANRNSDLHGNADRLPRHIPCIRRTKWNKHGIKVYLLALCPIYGPQCHKGHLV